MAQGDKGYLVYTRPDSGSYYGKTAGINGLPDVVTHVDTNALLSLNGVAVEPGDTWGPLLVPVVEQRYDDYGILDSEGDVREKIASAAKFVLEAQLTELEVNASTDIIFQYDTNRELAALVLERLSQK